MKLTKELSKEYLDMYHAMEINNTWLNLVRRNASFINGNKNTYTPIFLNSQVPWYLVGLVHKMEAGYEDLIAGKDGKSFECNLFNGQYYWKKTTIVPKGKGPFSNWNIAAIQAMQDLNKKMMRQIPNWDGKYTIDVILFMAEMHNGWGYRIYHPEVKSPYLWSFSNMYSKGRYVADGKFKSSSVSQQCGIAPILKILIDQINGIEIPIPVNNLPKTEGESSPKANETKWTRFKKCAKRKLRF